MLKTEIGFGTIVHAGVVIYKNVSIGAKNLIHANSVIHSGSKLGDKCVINANAVIGGEGFGFVPTSNGWKKMMKVKNGTTNVLKIWRIMKISLDMIGILVEVEFMKELMKINENLQKPIHNV